MNIGSNWKATSIIRQVVNIRTLELNNLAVGTNIAPVPVAQAPGIPRQVVVALSRTISADLTVTINITRNSVLTALVTITVPAATPVMMPLTFTTFSMNMIQLSDVFSADIVASDGSVNGNGIATFTLEWY